MNIAQVRLSPGADGELLTPEILRHYNTGSSLSAILAVLFLSFVSSLATGDAMRLLLSLALGSILVANCRADILFYDNGAGGPTGIAYAFESDTTGPFRQADNVSFSESVRLVRATWTGAYGGFGPTQADDFTINVHSDDHGLPGAVAASFHAGNDVKRLDTGIDVSTLDVFKYSAALDFVVMPNTTYYLSIVNSTQESDWGWGAIQGQGLNAYNSLTSGVTWTNISSSIFDFQLYTVPEPSTSCLLAVFAVALFGRRRRTK